MKNILFFLLIVIPSLIFGQAPFKTDTLKVTYIKSLKPALAKIYLTDTVVFKNGQKQISAFTEALKSNYNTAYNLSHAHLNKSVLDGIKATDTTRWASGGTTYTANLPIVVTGSVISVDTLKHQKGLMTYNDGLGKEPVQSGTGFVKKSGTTISYDNSTYLTTTGNGSGLTGITASQVGAQQTLTLTTNGTSGAATLNAGTLNIPQYSGGSGTSITAGINASIQNNILNVTTPLPTSDTIYILMSGQSNAGFSASDSNVGDTIFNANVKIWDWTQNKWVVAIVGKSPFTSGGHLASGNSGWYFAKKINEVTGKKVKIVLHYHAATAISSWHNGTVKGVDLDSLIFKASHSGVQKFNLFIWEQGESDTYTNYTYIQSYDSIKATLRRQSWFPATTPIVVVGMPQLKYGAQKGSQGADKYLKGVDGNNDQWDIYADTDSCLIVPTNNLHFNNIGLKKLGSEKIYNAYNKLPTYNVGSYIRPNYGWFVHWDSLNTNRHALVLQNMSSYGNTGILMQSYNGTDAFRFISTNTNSTFTPFTAGQNIISSENNKDLGIYTGLTERLKISADGINTFGGRIIMNNASAAGAQIKLQVAGVDLGILCSAATAGGTATDLANYVFGANNYQIYTNGTKRFNVSGTGIVSTQIGASSSLATIGGVINTMYSDTSSVSTTETPLYRSTLPNSPFVTNGDFVTYELEGTYADNTNAKTLNIYLAGNLLETITQTTPAATLYSFKIRIKIFRVSTTGLRIFTDFQSDITGTSVVTSKLKTQDLTLGSPYFNQTLLISVTGTGTSTGDLIGKTGLTRYK
jgi:hypothetical protein